MKRFSWLAAIGLVVIISSTTYAETFFAWRYRNHATDCTAISDGKDTDLCYEIDSDRLFKFDGGTWNLVSGSPGGSDTQVQLNDSGVFLGDAGFTYNKTTDIATLAGGLTLSNLTSGSILFAGASGAISQDNSNLFWDDTNNRLGLMTSAPGDLLDIVAVSGFGIRLVSVSGGNAIAGFRLGSNNEGFCFLRESTGNTDKVYLHADGNSYFQPTTAANVSLILRGAVSQSGDLLQLQNSSNTVLTSADSSGKISKYNSISATGWGVPAIYGTGRSTAQTGDVASVATYTVSASDGSFIVSSNVLVTAYTAGTQSVQVDYTDESNTARNLTLTFSNLGGTFSTAISAASPFEGIPLHIRCKASTSITIKTVGTTWQGTYNVEGSIQQIS